MKHYSDLKAAPPGDHRAGRQRENEISKKHKKGRKESKKTAQGIDRNCEDLQGLVLVPFRGIDDNVIN